MVKEIISKRLMLLVTFGGLLLMKVLGFNSSTDDAILIVIGAIVGKEVLVDGKK